MKKDITDYLHLYLGCEVEYGYEGRRSIGDLHGLDPKFGWKVFTRRPIPDYHTVRTELIKLILRPLSDMTDQEMDEVWYGHEPKNVLVMDYKNSGITRKVALCSERTRYLLSKGFDLFGLIAAGLAIDKTLIKS